MAPRTTRRSLAAAKGGSQVQEPAEKQVQPAKKSSARSSRAKPSIKQEDARPSPNTARKRRRDAVEEPTDEDTTVVKKEGNGKQASPPSKRGRKADLDAGKKMADKFVEARDTQAKQSSPERNARTKNNPYGLSPGETPFPTYPHPTPEECHNVRNILAKAHGDVAAPKTIPTPSLNSSGCGEVPSVLDALIRTRLSAATNNSNSSRAFRGLVETFGIIKEGVGKGSVDWNKVRLAPVKEVFGAIQSGGLADVKSRDIQKILNMVYEENQQRKSELSKQGQVKADEGDEDADEKKQEIAKASHEVLSLDHLHLLDNDAAFNKLLGYPGVGPKTASCVLLFCMQRPSFAVDTHVFRLTQWLGWVPTDAQAKAMMKRGESKSAQVTRNSTYAHLDVKIPDELKYPLHYLLIKHGKHCGWCSAKAGKDRKTGTCPLASLMKGKGRSKGLAKKGEQENDEPEVKDEDVEEEDDDESE